MFMRKQIPLTLSSVFLAALALGPAARAQQAPAGASATDAQSAAAAPAAATTTTSSQPVVLPVTVRDKKGELVTNLQKSDFSLTQDGRPQTIESLTRDTAQPFRVGLLVDTSKAMTGALEAERKAAANFVDLVIPAEASGNKDQAFLIHFDREVELLEDFTNSRDKLHQELEDMGSSGKQRDDRGGPETTGDERTPDTNRRATDQLYDAIFLAADELMKNKDGRKALVIFSDGADHGSKETMNDAVDAADRAGLAVYTIFFKGQPERSYGADNFPSNRRGGIGYPGGGGGYPGGYPGGGGGRRQPEPTTATGMDGKRIMQEIATRTGGHAYEAKKTSDLEPIYKLISEELRGQFLLTYTPDKPDSEGGFHKIALTTSNKDWTVSTREGYYAPEKQ
jgi:VWFA-related protein